jgi:hypothetical protein
VRCIITVALPVLPWHPSWFCCLDIPW